LFRILLQCGALNSLDGLKTVCFSKDGITGNEGVSPMSHDNRSRSRIDSAIHLDADVWTDKIAYIGDLGGGLFGVIGLLSAIYERERSGRGQHVDISMLDCQISMLNYMATMYFLSGEEPCPIGNSHFVHVPYDTFTCSDGFIVIAVITDNFWHNLKTVVGIQEFNDPKYDSQPGRFADREFINAQLNTVLATNSCDYWVSQLEAKRIPCAPVNNFSAALSDAQVLHRKMVVELKHPDGSSTSGPGNPIKFSRTGEESYAAAPRLGEHTRDVLSGLLGMSDNEIEGMRIQGVIA